MTQEALIIKKGHEIDRTKRTGKLYRLIVKSKKMETIIAELDPHRESQWFKHKGEELHIVLEGEMEYTVGEKSYKLKQGDMFWHRSDLKHHAKNIGTTKVVYITVSTPPTFMWDTL